jgi:hypothetical protein
MLALVLVVFPASRIILSATSTTIALICFTAISVIMCENFLQRKRYAVSKDRITVQYVAGFEVVQASEIFLEEADARIDFEKGVIEIRNSAEATTISLYELLYPHRFAKQLVNLGV